MHVTMTQHISGYRDGQPWPLAGEVVELDDVDAEHLITAGYAKEATPDEIEQHELKLAAADAAPADDGGADAGNDGAAAPADDGSAGAGDADTLTVVSWHVDPDGLDADDRAQFEAAAAGVAALDDGALVALVESHTGRKPGDDATRDDLVSLLAFGWPEQVAHDESNPLVITTESTAPATTPETPETPETPKPRKPRGAAAGNG